MKKYKYRQTFVHNGKRYDIKGDSKKDVNQKMAKKMMELEKQTPTKATALFKDYAWYVLENYRKPRVKENTYYNMTKVLELYILPSLQDERLADIKRVDCQRVLNKMDGFSTDTIARVKNLMQSIFRQARYDGLLVANPTEGLTIPKGSKNTRRSLTIEEQEAFLKACKDDRFLVFLLSYYCGCRPEEARGCKGSDLVTVDGVNMLHIRGTKTEKADRLVPINDELYQRVKNVAENDYLAPNNRHEHMSQPVYADRWSRCLEKIWEHGIGEDLVPYCLRHTFCTNLQKQGVDIRTAQKLMGHADIKMTVNIYTHVDNTEIVKASKLMQKSPI